MRRALSALRAYAEARRPGRLRSTHAAQPAPLRLAAALSYYSYTASSFHVIPP